MTLKITVYSRAKESTKMYTLFFPELRIILHFNIYVTFWKPVLKFFQLLWQVHHVLIASLLMGFVSKYQITQFPVFARKVCPAFVLLSRLYWWFFGQLHSCHPMLSLHPPVLDLLWPNLLM